LPGAADLFLYGSIKICLLFLQTKENLLPQVRQQGKGILF